jgi:hypothetical protein
MTFDVLADGSFRLWILVVLACAFLIAGMLIGEWTARRRQAKHYQILRGAEAVAKAPAAPQVVKSGEDFTWPSAASVREWDDAPPRPNWNRQISHYWPRPTSKQPR